MQFIKPIIFLWSQIKQIIQIKSIQYSKWINKNKCTRQPKSSHSSKFATSAKGVSNDAAVAPQATVATVASPRNMGIGFLGLGAPKKALPLFEKFRCAFCVSCLLFFSDFYVFVFVFCCFFGGILSEY